MSYLTYFYNFHYPSAITKTDCMVKLQVYSCITHEEYTVCKSNVSTRLSHFCGQHAGSIPPPFIWVLIHGLIISITSCIFAAIGHFNLTQVIWHLQYSIAIVTLCHTRNLTTIMAKLFLQTISKPWQYS